MPKVLVTGGAGFIGQHVVAALLKRGHQVLVVDHLRSIRPHTLKPQPNLEVRQINVLDRDDMWKAMQDCVHVIHLAGQSNVSQSMVSPDFSFFTNVAGTEMVLSLAKELALPGWVVFASSAAVYGDTPALPVKESDAVGQVPLSPYGTSKALNELQALGWRKAFGVRTLGVRMFNVYGPGQDPENPAVGIVTKMVNSIEKGDLLTIYGDGLQKRDYVAVTDVALVMAKLLDLPVNKLAEIPPVLNVASGMATTLNDLLRHIAGVMGRNPKLEYRSARPGEIKDSWADISALRAVLPDWQPQSLQAGLKAWLAKPPTA
jgi:UDP-glucose 4-epimerase